MENLQFDAREILCFIAEYNGMQRLDEVILKNFAGQVLMIPEAFLFLVLAVATPDLFIYDLISFGCDTLLLGRNLEVVVGLQVIFWADPLDVGADHMPRDIGVEELPR